MGERLQDKVALITGSDSDIGQATAIEFAKEGGDVVVNYLHDKEGAEETPEAVERAGRGAIVARADVSDETQVADLFEQAVGGFGRFDILIAAMTSSLSFGMTTRIGSCRYWTSPWSRARA